MTAPLEIFVILVGVSFVGLGIYGAAPLFLAWRRRSREPRPLGVFNVSEAFPLLRQDLETVAPEPAARPVLAPAVAEPAPSGLLDEVGLLHQEVDGLRREIGSLRIAQRRRPRPLQPAAELPAALRRQLVVVRQLRRRRGLAIASTLGASHSPPRRIA